MEGCGFQPLYGSAGNTNVGVELASVEISLIKDRIGQKLRNHLMDRINPSGAPEAPNYTLVVTLEVIKQNLAVKKSKISTRANLQITATFSLVGKNRNVGKRFSGTSKIVTSYNILSSDFATLIAEQDAKERAVKELSSNISNRVATFVQGSLSR